MPLSVDPTTGAIQQPTAGGRQSLAASAYQAIYRNIISLAYEPGQRLEEGLLVEQLGIGRTPVREALLSLAGDLLVESSPGKGYTVRPLTIQNTKAAFDALMVMELGVARLSVRQDPTPFLEPMKAANRDVVAAIEKMEIIELVEANSQFHGYFAASSRNLYLIQALRTVRCATNRLAYLSYSNEINPQVSLKEHYRSVTTQHDQIVEQLSQRDEEALVAAIEQHILIFKERMITYLTA